MVSPVCYDQDSKDEILPRISYRNARMNNINNNSESSSLSSVEALLAQTLRDCAIDPAPLFEKAGIDLAVISNPDARIPTARENHLWQLAIDATANPCLGLEAAKHFQPAMLHGLGFAWLASDSLYDALARLVRFSHFINRAVDFKLEETDTTVELVIRIPDVLQDGVYALDDLGMAVFLQMCRITAGERIMPLRVSMQRPRPDCEARFREMFGETIEYAAADYRLVFDKQEVHEPLMTAQPELVRMNDQTVIDYLARYERSSIIMQVKSRIIDQLVNGIPQQQGVAEALHVSLRSLQRKLRAENTSYKDILNETRQQLALQYIRESHRSIGEITYLLGFTEPSNFARAFKRWTGKSPAEYREKRVVSGRHT